MTRGVILKRVTVTAMWHDDSLTRGNFFNFFKKIQKKIKNKKKFKKKIIKKFKKSRN